MDKLLGYRVVKSFIFCMLFGWWGFEGFPGRFGGINSFYLLCFHKLIRNFV
jgi:hypothetical protein